MKVVLSFDDGRLDNYTVAYPILQRHSLVATFHVVTGFIDGTFESESFGLGRHPLSVENLFQMQRSGMEIASHGDTHIMTPYDFSVSFQKLKNWGIANGKIGFSIPNSHYSDNDLSIFVNAANDNLLYIRAGRSPKCYSFFRKSAFIFYRITKTQFSYNFFNSPNLQTKGRIPFCSMVVRKETNVNNLINFLVKYSKKDLYVIIMLHSIVENPKNTWEWSAQNFQTLCSFLSIRNNQITVLTNKELQKTLSTKL